MLKTKIHTIETDVRTIIESYFQEYIQNEGYSVVVNYVGVLSHDLINSLAIGVENAMISSGDKKYIIKRMFAILIEGMQNIKIHGDKDENGDQLACVLVVKKESSYKILFGNLVLETDKASLKTYVGNINNHDENELKTLYLSVLNHGYLSKKGGAGLGVITMRLKSSNKLNYKLYNLTDLKTFFAIEVELNRN